MQARAQSIYSATSADADEFERAVEEDEEEEDDEQSELAALSAITEQAGKFPSPFSLYFSSLERNIQSNFFRSFSI
jgi:hypothetical protein